LPQLQGGNTDGVPLRRGRARSSALDEDPAGPRRHYARTGPCGLNRKAGVHLVLLRRCPLEACLFLGDGHTKPHEGFLSLIKVINQGHWSFVILVHFSPLAMTITYHNMTIKPKRGCQWIDFRTKAGRSLGAGGLLINAEHSAQAHVMRGLDETAARACDETAAHQSAACYF